MIQHHSTLMSFKLLKGECTTTVKSLELFGGIGAPRKALQKANFDLIPEDYVEILPYAVKAYNSLFCNDFRPQNIITWNRNIDILIHGSPCQDFSKNGLNNINTGRSILYERTLEIIEYELLRKPLVVIWENVPNLLAKRHGYHFDHYLMTMEKLGYTNSYKILCANDYGIPQKRYRIIVVSTLVMKPFIFPTIAKTSHIKDFLDYTVNAHDYTLSQNEMSLFFRKNEKLFIRMNTKLGYEEIEQFDVINVERPNSRTRRGRVGKGIANTLTTNPKQVVYFNGILRHLTSKEHVRLTGFDDSDYEKMKSVGLQDKQISSLMGNSIVVDMLVAIFCALRNQGYIK